MNSVEPDRAPLGAPRHGVFGGVLEGSVGDAGALRAAAGRLPAVRHDLRIDGGRFSLLLDDAPVSGALLGTEAQDALLEALGDIARAADPARPLESNLRATLVHETRAVETLFTVEERAGERTIAPISRERPVSADDERASRGTHGDGGIGAPFRGLSRGRRLLFLALIAVAGALGAQQTGLVDVARSALDRSPAADVARDTGPFDDLVEVSVDRTLTSWACVVTRGAGYPATPAALDARIAAAFTIPARAAARAAGEGGAAWLRGLDVDGEVVAAAPLDLRALAADAEGHVDALLAPLHRIESVEVALTPGIDVEAR